MKLRRENPVFFITQFLSRKYSFMTVRDSLGQRPGYAEAVQDPGLRPREKKFKEEAERWDFLRGKCIVFPLGRIS
jgi:hypothetical protein